MSLTKIFKLDLAQKSTIPNIHAKLGDINLRAIGLSLYFDGAPWAIPQGTTMTVLYQKPDGTAGVYDTLPDGTTQAVTYQDNTLTVSLIPQVFTAPGKVLCEVMLSSPDGQITTFDFSVTVAPSVIGKTALESTNYFRYASLEALNTALDEALKGAAAALAASSAAEAAYEGAKASETAAGLHKNAAQSSAQAAEADALSAAQSLENMMTLLGGEDPEILVTVSDLDAVKKSISDLRAFLGYTDPDILGVEVDLVNKTFTRLAGAVGKTPGADFNAFPAFGGRRRCCLTDGGALVAYYGQPGYSETGYLTQAVTANGTVYNTGTPVQVMVEQPRFFYRVVPLALEKVPDGPGYLTRKLRYYISDQPRLGFRLHPAFLCQGEEKEKIYLSAYEGSIYDASAGAYILDDAQTADFSSDRLASIAGAKPISGEFQNLTRANARMLAQNRGFGWAQQYAATVSATQMLMVVEFATLNFRSALGSGVVFKPSGNGESLAEQTGATGSLGCESGTAVNANGIAALSYRGEENFWGNIWKFVDGMNIRSSGIHTLYVADHDFADGVYEGAYESTGITLAKQNGFVSAFGYTPDFDWLFVPGETLGNSLLPVGDYFYQNHTSSAILVSQLGGTWYSGDGAGAFNWSFDDAAGRHDFNLGCRAVYIPG